MRILISESPFASRQTSVAWNKRGAWPACWAAPDEPLSTPFAVLYRLEFSLEQARTVRIHASADERYELWLDGALAGRGPERGEPDAWRFETYERRLEAGPHTLLARAWSLGSARDLAPYAQMSLCHGFLLCPDDEELLDALATGRAPWQWQQIRGVTFLEPGMAWGTGARVDIEGSKWNGDPLNPPLEGWREVQVLGAARDRAGTNDNPPTHLLVPALLPPQIDQAWSRGRVRFAGFLPEREDGSIFTSATPILAKESDAQEAERWQALFESGRSLSIPPRTRRRVLLDLDDYACAYPLLRTRGGRGSMVRVHWQECLFEDALAPRKGNRDEVEGKYFTSIWARTEGIGDTFRPSGQGSEPENFRTFWWSCGRYVEVVVQTADKPLTIESFELRETRYPLEAASTWECDEERTRGVWRLGLRALQMCAHETYMDCPYYEQLMYIGDTRLQVLATFALSHDERLPRKALLEFDASRTQSRATGLTQSRFPSRVFQSIPPFSLWHVAMLHDFALWRGGLDFLRPLMRGARGVLDFWLSCLSSDGLIVPPDGWNYVDWVPAWPHGMPPLPFDEPNGPLCWQVAYALRLAAELETWLGEPHAASRWKAKADALEAATHAAFWDEGRGLWADDRARAHFSEHAQCLALLQSSRGGSLPASTCARASKNLAEAPDLERATIYFSHYLFEALGQAGRADVLFERLRDWFALEDMGLRTTVEMPEPTRSDCHAWGAHPLFHFFATFAGLRPAAPGFETIIVRPQLGPLRWARGTMAHPRGEVVFDLRREGEVLSGRISLPEGVSGVVNWAGNEARLRSGENRFELP